MGYGWSLGELSRVGWAGRTVERVEDGRQEPRFHFCLCVVGLEARPSWMERLEGMEYEKARNMFREQRIS